MIARSARGGAPVPTRRSPEEGSSGSRATRFAPSAWPTSPPSSRRAISSWVPPRPDQETPVGGCPLPPAEQRDLGVDEASRVGDRQAEPPAADSVQWQRDRSGLIAAVAPLGRCVPATRAHPSGRSPADRRLTNRRHGCRRTACSPIAARGQTPSPPGTANASLKFGFAARGIELPQWVGRCCYNHPHVPPSAAASALFCSALMPGRPARGRRSQTSTRATLLRSQPNTSGSRRPNSGTLRMHWR